MVSTLKLTKIQIPNSDSDVISLDASSGNVTLNKTLGGTSITVQGEGTATTNLQQGLAKAWVLGTNAAALTDSFNIASGTDQGTGNYDYAFTNNFASANYSAAGVCAEGAANFMISAVRSTSVSTQKILTHAGSAADVVNNSNICGDLA